MKLRARIWTPEPSLNDRVVEVDLEEVIKNTKLPVPILIEFDPERKVGEVTELSAKDGCLEAVLDLDEPMGKVLTRFEEDSRAKVKPAIGWKTWASPPSHPLVYVALEVFAMGFSAHPAVPGTYIEEEPKES